MGGLRVFWGPSIPRGTGGGQRHASFHCEALGALFSGPMGGLGPAPNLLKRGWAEAVAGSRGPGRAGLSHGVRQGKKAIPKEEATPAKEEAQESCQETSIQAQEGPREGEAKTRGAAEESGHQRLLRAPRRQGAQPDQARRQAPLPRGQGADGELPARRLPAGFEGGRPAEAGEPPSRRRPLARPSRPPPRDAEEVQAGDQHGRAKRALKARPSLLPLL